MKSNNNNNLLKIACLAVACCASVFTLATCHYSGVQTVNRTYCRMSLRIALLSYANSHNGAFPLRCNEAGQSWRRQLVDYVHSDTVSLLHHDLVTNGDASLFASSPTQGTEKTEYFGVFDTEGNWIASQVAEDRNCAILIETAESESKWNECDDIVLVDNKIFLDSGRNAMSTEVEPRGLVVVRLIDAEIIPTTLPEKDVAEFFRGEK